MSAPLVHYRSPVEDSGRWFGFRFRPGDIVLSTRRKTGTTWLQMICALLIFQTPELPDPLWQLSPWLDNVGMPHDYVYDQLARQSHRRFIKTHTPLDGVPLDPRVTYIVTARHPLDAFVSLCRHHEMMPLPEGPPPRGSGPPPGPPPGGRAPHRSPPGPLSPPASRRSLHDALIRWIADDDSGHRDPDSLPGIMRHLSDAWSRRDEPNVLLVRYEDLLANLEDRMRWLAERLEIAVPEDAWPALTQAADFKRMRDRADTLVEVPPGASVDTALFFRRGTTGAGREILSDEELADYYQRAALLAPPDLLDWLHAP